VVEAAPAPAVEAAAVPSPLQRDLLAELAVASPASEVPAVAAPDAENASDRDDRPRPV
jgi:hypothetical protein